MIKNLAQKISLTLLFALIIISCGTDKIPENMAVEEIYAEGLKQFQDENWLEAKEYFDVIKLQYPASQYADDAQYFLSEINYERGEYIYAAFNYNLLRRVYPGSEYSK
ncbi:MAG: outer membrane protein assembly factor BamD, partial [Bacteroidota bacterium]